MIDTRVTWMVATAVLVAVALAAFTTGSRWRAHAYAAPGFQTPFQAVLLDNGQLYYGKLEGLGTPFPALRDVYYIQTSMNTQTNQQTNVLMKRGKEWHAPDRMVLNANHILLVEPVAPDSKVAGLISDAKSQ